MTLPIGSGSNPSKLYLGNQVVSKVYKGVEVVWEGGGDAGAPSPLVSRQWALYGPLAHSFTIVVFEMPAGSTVFYRLNGNAWISTGLTAAGEFEVTSLAQEVSYRVELMLQEGVQSLPSDSKSIQTIPVDPRAFRGRYTNVNLGTTADYFVSPNGNDGNSGTSESIPFLTWAAANAVAVSGDVIKGRAGKYSEKVIPKDGVTYEGYGTEMPQIMAADTLIGLTQCTVADVSVLGPVLGVNGSPVYKASILKANAEFTDPYAINAYEADKRLFAVSDRADSSDLFNRDDKTTFHVADSFGLDGSNQVQTITDASVINSTKYSNADLVGARVRLYHNPNVTSVVTVVAADVNNNQITIDGNKIVQGDTPTPAVDDLRFTITGIGSALQQGQYHAEGNGANFDIYIWPRDADNLDVIEVSTRNTVFNFGSNVSNVSIRGIHVSRAVGDVDKSGVNILSSNNSDVNNNILIEHCLSTGILNPATKTHSIRFSGATNSSIVRTSIYDVDRGVFFQGPLFNYTTYSDKNKYDHCFADKTANSPYITYHQNDFVFSHNYGDRCGRGAHANLYNNYEETHGFLAWGNEFTKNSIGYLTWQEATNANVAFNFMQLNSDYTDARKIYGQDHRYVADSYVLNGGGQVTRITDVNVIVSTLYTNADLVGTRAKILDINSDVVTVNITAADVAGGWIDIDGTVTPHATKKDYALERSQGGKGRLFNNTIIPHTTNTGNAATIDTSREWDFKSWEVYNNIGYGFTRPANYAESIVAFKTNLIQRLIYDGSSQTVAAFADNGGSIDANVVDTNLTTAYVDPSNNDYTPKAGGAILTTKGTNMSTDVTALRAEFPHFTGWNRDAFNNIIDWTENPLGADTGLPFDHQIVDPPAADTFTTVLAGPRFTDTSNIAPGTTAMTFSTKIKDGFIAENSKYFIHGASNTFVVTTLANRKVRITAEDNEVLIINSETAGAVLPASGDYILTVAIDLVAGWAKVLIDNIEQTQLTWIPGAGVFVSNRKVTLLNIAAGTGQVVGEFEYVKFWYSATADGAEPGSVPDALIEGPAATANAHTWKLGADAV